MSTIPQDGSTGDTAVFASGLSIFASGMPMFTLAHDAPLSLDDASRCWIVRSGSLDLFLVPEGGGRQHPVLRINAGDAVLGTGSPHGWRMIALGSQGARVTELAAAQLYDSDVGRDAIARWLQAWNVRLKDKPFPKKVERVQPGQPLVLATGECAVPMDDSTCVELETGDASFMGAVVLAPQTALFVTASGWIEATNDCRFHARAAADLAAEGRLGAVLEATHAAYIACLRDNFAQAAVRERARLGVRARKDQARMRAATATLRSVVLGDAARGADTTDMLLAACRVVGVAAGIDFIEHPATKRGLPQADPLGNIASASRVRKRSVALKGEWWKTDSGPLIAFYGEVRSPVALIPVRGRGYNLHDPISGKVMPVDAALAQQLQPFAYTFYRSFAAPALDLLALMRFASFGITREIFLVLVLGLVAGILGLAAPFLTGQLFDDIIPSADKSRLWQIVFALAAAGIAGSMFDITRSFTILRMEGRVDSNVQAAVWDRLLRLPVPFFRKYTAGDLAMRAGAINAIRTALSGSVMSVVFSSLFSMLNLILLFYYSSRLAWIAVLLVGLLFIFTITGSMIRLYFERRLAEGAGKQAGMVLQFLLGIAKLRAAGAEGRAFGLWAANYAKQQRYVYSAQTIGTVLGSISATYPLLASLVIFIAVTMFMTDLKTPLTTGEFLAFNAAFGAFLGAALGLGSTLLGLLSVIPMYERAETILKAEPEIAAGKGDPGLLTGAIELSHVSFSYDKDLPPVLDDVSLQIRAGEFVAFVGPSGSGKSTLLRLLLGFETPGAGTVFYDGQDLSSLDVGAVRRQTGVVLQNGQLLGGDIYSNIVGSAPLSLAEAADAAKACGLEDDINNMPMGMHTLIPDGGGSLSGGQRQRLLIARAIVTKPRILFLDEATSALDNRNQALVTDSLRALRTTRVMIAHRLSTIIDADRIFVLHNGHIVQEGDFVSLMAQPGIFKDLASRQIA